MYHHALQYVSTSIYIFALILAIMRICITILFGLCFIWTIWITYVFVLLLLFGLFYDICMYICIFASISASIFASISAISWFLFLYVLLLQLLLALWFAYVSVYYCYSAILQYCYYYYFYWPLYYDLRIIILLAYLAFPNKRLTITCVFVNGLQSYLSLYLFCRPLKAFYPRSTIKYLFLFQISESRCV